MKSVAKFEHNRSRPYSVRLTPQLVAMLVVHLAEHDKLVTTASGALRRAIFSYCEQQIEAGRMRALTVDEVTTVFENLSDSESDLMAEAQRLFDSASASTAAEDELADNLFKAQPILGLDNG